MATIMSRGPNDAADRVPGGGIRPSKPTFPFLPPIFGGPTVESVILLRRRGCGFESRHRGLARCSSIGRALKSRPATTCPPKTIEFCTESVPKSFRFRCGIHGKIGAELVRLSWLKAGLGPVERFKSATRSITNLPQCFLTDSAGPNGYRLSRFNSWAQLRLHPSDSAHLSGH
jgi:hypothetical protein